MIFKPNLKRRYLLQKLLAKNRDKIESNLVEKEIKKGVFSTKMNRRELLYNIGLASAGITVGTIIGACDDNNSNANDNRDLDILNFALNLEYLEAEYYLRGTFGMGLSNEDRGIGAGEVIGGRQVPFSSGSLIEQYAREIAEDELAHVRFLRLALGDAAVPSPDINFTDAFNSIGFDPFENEFNFLLGAFVFEDVGVTAYNGAAPLIKDKNILAAAASILAVEAYHAGEIRVVLFALGQSNPSLIDTANAISNARDSLNPGVDKDQPITVDGATSGDANIVPTDSNGLAFSRSTKEVLNIVYLNANTEPGGFFPNGLNGSIA
jgi:hypothetical protein